MGLIATSRLHTRGMHIAYTIEGTPEALDPPLHAPVPGLAADAIAGDDDAPQAPVLPETEPQPVQTGAGAARNLAAGAVLAEPLSGPPTPGPPTPPPVSATAGGAAGAAHAGVLAQAAGRVEQGDGKTEQGGGWEEALAEEEACSEVPAEQGGGQGPGERELHENSIFVVRAPLPFL
eukprot:1158251-Pelagomonas_calceolata.AAC.2